MEITVLVMTFKDDWGKTRSIEVPKPRMDLDSSDVKAVMQTIVDKNCLVVRSIPIKEIVSAKIIAKTISELDIEA